MSAETNITHPIETGSTLPTESLQLVHEITVSEEASATSGLRANILRWRLGRAEDAADRLASSAEAHKWAARTAADRKEPPPEARPATRLQHRQALRAARRQHKVNKMHLRNLALKMGYGDAIAEESLYGEQLAKGYYGAPELRRRNKAGQRYLSQANRIEKHAGRVSRSADGEDIPGRAINWRLWRKQNKVEELRSKLDATDPYNQITDSPMTPEQLTHRRFSVGVREYYEPQNLLNLYGRVLQEVRHRSRLYHTESGLSPDEPLPQQALNRVKDEVQKELIAEYIGLEKTPPSLAARIEEELEYIANPAAREAAIRAAEAADKERAIVTPGHLDSANLTILKAQIQKAITDTAHTIKDVLGYGASEKLSRKEFSDLAKSVTRAAIARYLGVSDISDEIYGRIVGKLDKIPSGRTRSAQQNDARAGVSTPATSKDEGVRSEIVIATPYNDEELLRTEHGIETEIRDWAHDQQRIRGISKVPNDEFKDYARRVREARWQEFFGDNPPAAHIQQLARQHARSLREQAMARLKDENPGEQLPASANRSGEVKYSDLDPDYLELLKSVPNA